MSIELVASNISSLLVLELRSNELSSNVTVFVKKSLSVLSIVATVVTDPRILPFADSPEH